jgi:hypothetical protein
MKTTTNYSYEEVQNMDCPDTVLFSITGGVTAVPPLKRWKRVLHFRFDDILPGGIRAGYRGTNPIIDPDEHPMTTEHARQMAKAIRKFWDSSIHVHCAAGMSRSAAVAEVLAELGWEYIVPPARPWGTKYANQHVLSLLKLEFPEKWGLIGQ